MPYTYHRSKDGTEETFDVITPTGEHLVSIYYWEDAAAAEAKAKLIIEALNAYEGK